VIWQWQLHQNSMDGWVAIQLVHQSQKLFLIGLQIQAVQCAVHAGGRTGAFFVAYVNLAGRVIANQYGGEMRYDRMCPHELSRFALKPPANGFRNVFSVNQSCCH
jgi:hypothetical protein